MAGTHASPGSSGPSASSSPARRSPANTRVGERLRPRWPTPRPGPALGTCGPEHSGRHGRVSGPSTPGSPGRPQQDPSAHAAGHGGGHDRPRDRKTEHVQGVGYHSNRVGSEVNAPGPSLDFRPHPVVGFFSSSLIVCFLLECMHEHQVGACGHQKVLCGFWELNSGSLQEQQ